MSTWFDLVGEPAEQQHCILFIVVVTFFVHFLEIFPELVCIEIIILLDPSSLTSFDKMLPVHF